MANITYSTDISDVDWAEMKATLSMDEFDNGRTPDQLCRSFENSLACVAYADGRIIGTARALSDGVCNAYIVDVWTHSDFRRQGIATRMMRTLESEFDGQHVHTFSDLPEVYESMGYTRQDISLSKVIGTWLENETR